MDDSTAHVHENSNSTATPAPGRGNPDAEVKFWLHRDVADLSGKGRAGFAVGPKTNGFAAGLSWVHRLFFWHNGVTAQ
jgi:hypothetical protein